ncbi:MAG: hypothetical protein R3B13_36945 [Polyangiaceae bacterium]
MTRTIWGLALAAAVAVPFLGCSSSDDGTTPGSGTQQDERRTTIGKADSLSGKCIDGNKNYCGGKSKGKCWCDTACVKYGDCCTDAEASCGIGATVKCDSSADCKTGEYCHAAAGCGSQGECKAKPTNIACTAVITPYCDCNGKTQYSPSGCVFDRYDHMGECQTKTCGGIANLPCPSGQICVDDPSDNCDPNNGGADCGGICKPKTMCGGFANLPCPDGYDCVDDPDDSCDPNNGGADCSGVCIPKAGCSPVMCELYCPYGFQKDASGCEVCKCNEPPAQNSCAGNCGAPSPDKSCYCDSLCEKYKDCCADYQAQCKETRTPASGQCVKNSNDACSTDADCLGGGCGGELCYNPALGSGISTCECTAPMNVKGCGCVAGKCTWYN